MKIAINESRKFLINRLGYFRNKAKLSARELSLRLGLSSTYISKFEAGQINIPSQILMDAIEVCGISPEEFFCENIETYFEVKEIIAKYKKLSPESRALLSQLLNHMK